MHSLDSNFRWVWAISSSYDLYSEVHSSHWSNGRCSWRIQSTSGFHCFNLPFTWIGLLLYDSPARDIFLSKLNFLIFLQKNISSQRMYILRWFWKKWVGQRHGKVLSSRRVNRWESMRSWWASRGSEMLGMLIIYY